MPTTDPPPRTAISTAPRADPVSDQRVDSVREKIYENALRMGLIVRAYVSRPDQRLHIRHALAELLEDARHLSDEVQALSHGHPQPALVNAGDEADRLVAMITSLRAVFARLESLERKRATTPSTGADREAQAGMRSEIDRLVAKLGREEEQLLSLETELQGERRLRLRESWKADELRRMRRRLGAAEGRLLSAAAQRVRLRRKIQTSDDLIRKLRRKLRLAKKGATLKRRRSSPSRVPKRKLRGRGRATTKRRAGHRSARR